MRKILLITSVLPWPLRRNGGAQRTALLRDALARHGRVDVLMVSGVTPNDKPIAPEALAAQNVVGRIIRPDLPPKAPWFLPGPLGAVSRTIDKYASHYRPDAEASDTLSRLMRDTKYDLIVSRYLQPAVQCGVSRFADVPSVLDFDDIDWMTLASQIAAKPWGGLTGRFAARQVLSRVTEIAQSALRPFKRVFVTCEEDTLLLPRDGVVLPNIPFSADSQCWLPALPPRPSENLLFVGDLQFPPNREGLDHFLDHVWPKVIRQRPTATLSIVGRGLSDASRAKWSIVPGVTVIGFAENLEACYGDCALSIVPIYFGGGTKIKVVESLAYNRAVATTPQSMRGYAALENNGVTVGRSDDELAGHIVRLLADAAERDRQATLGRTLVERHFSPGTFADVVDRTIQDVW